MEKKIRMENAEIISLVFGTCNENADTISETLGVEILCLEEDAAHASVTVRGENYESVEKAAALLEYLRHVVVRGDPITEQVLAYALSLAVEGEWEGVHSPGFRT